MKFVDTRCATTNVFWDIFCLDFHGSNESRAYVSELVADPMLTWLWTQLVGEVGAVLCRLTMPLPSGWAAG